MITPAELIKMYGYNVTLLNKQTEGLTHAQSLLAMPFEANSMNWILGHLVSSRRLVLKFVGQAPIWDDVQRVRYQAGSTNITADGEGVYTLPELLAFINQAQERLVAGLSQMSEDDLTKPSGWREMSIAEALVYLQYHEAHHVGQISFLAQLAGKPGVWLT